MGAGVAERPNHRAGSTERKGSLCRKRELLGPEKGKGMHPIISLPEGRLQLYGDEGSPDP